jgi:hypothetical protein
LDGIVIGRSQNTSFAANAHKRLLYPGGKVENVAFWDASKALNLIAVARDQPDVGASESRQSKKSKRSPSPDPP